jgi:hypothetical protein
MFQALIGELVVLHLVPITSRVIGLNIILFIFEKYLVVKIFNLGTDHLT